MGDKQVMDEEIQAMPLKYPKQTLVLLLYIFFERYSFYAVDVILSIYLRNQLKYTEDEATTYYHLFAFFLFSVPILGGIVADSCLGKYKTLVTGTTIYGISILILTFGAVPGIGVSQRLVTALALFLMISGTGFIKPITPALGGAQFKLPEQREDMEKFFPYFYYSINCGAFLAMMFAPALRRQSCFGEAQCYSLAFGIAFLSILIGYVALLMTKKKFKTEILPGNLLVLVIKCVMHALSSKGALKKAGDIRPHWLDYAQPKYSAQLIRDIKAFFQILVVFIPVPVFWALFFQQSSSLTFQASRMDGTVGEFLVIEPEHIRIYNPLLVIVLIPLFNQYIYKCIAKIGIVGPIRKMVVGGYLIAIAFYMAAFLEVILEKSSPKVPHTGNGQLRIYNGLDCDYELTIGDKKEPLKSLDVYTDKDIAVTGIIKFDISGISSDKKCPDINSSVIDVEEKKCISYFLKTLDNGTTFQRFEDDVTKLQSSYPTVRILSDYKESIIHFRIDIKTTPILSINSTSIDRHELYSGKYEVHIDELKIIDAYRIKPGGVFVYIISKSLAMKQIIITEPNSIHMLWIGFSYLVMTIAEVMFSPTAMEYSFSYAPKAMKSVIQGFYYFTQAVGNLIVIFVIQFLTLSQLNKFLLFGTLMIIVISIFAVIAYFISPKRPEEEA